MKHEDLQRLWGEMTRELGTQEVPEPIKTQLLADYEDEIDYAINTGDLTILVEKARGFYSVYRSIAPRGGKRRHKNASGETDQERTAEVGQYERLRAEVLSEYLAKMMALGPEIAQFRSDVLAGELLTPEQARAFFSSPATRYLGRNIWQTYGIPAKHIATLLGENYGRTEDGPFHWVQVRTDPPGETHAVFVPNPQSYENLTYMADNGRPERVTFWPGSVLGYLHNLCKQLTKSHPWDIDEAAWFVLTGKHPIVRPIKLKINSSWTVGTRAYTTISLTVQPWVPPETVEIVYRQLQKEVIGGSYGRISDKNLNLLRFVTERADSAGNLPKGKALVKDWDKKWKRQRPGWCYGADTRRFWRDFRSVQENVANSKRAGIILEAGQYMPEQYVQEIS